LVQNRHHTVCPTAVEIIGRKIKQLNIA